MALNPDTAKLIEQVKQERERLERQIAESRETIRRSKRLLADLDQMLTRLSVE